MKIINSFIADDGKKKTKVELIQIRMKYSFPKRYGYVLVHNRNLQGFFRPYFTKFFAKRRFNKLKKGYESCWLTYGVYKDVV